MKYTLIKNGNLIVGRNIAKGDLLICDGVIVDTDHKGQLPEGTNIVDACGKYVIKNRFSLAKSPLYYLPDIPAHDSIMSAISHRFLFPAHHNAVSTRR